MDFELQNLPILIIPMFRIGGHPSRSMEVAIVSIVHIRFLPENLDLFVLHI